MLLFPSYNYKSYFVQVPHDAGAQGQPPVRDQQRGLRDGVAPRARRHRVPGGQHGDQVDKTTVANYCQLLPTICRHRSQAGRGGHGGLLVRAGHGRAVVHRPLLPDIRHIQGQYRVVSELSESI